MCFKKVLLFTVSVGIAHSAFAQEDGHRSGKMDPQTLAALHADYARYAEANGIDDSKAPISSDYMLKKAANDIRLLDVLELASGNQKIFDQLELADEQREEVEEILERFKELKEVLKRKSEGANESARRHFEGLFRQGCRELTQELSEVLISFQSLELLESTIGTGGLLATLSKPTLAAKYVDLSDRQVERLKEKQDEIAEEVQEFIRKKRQELSEAFEDELTYAQQQRVVEFFGAEEVSRSFENATSETLMFLGGIQFQEQLGPKIKEWREIENGMKDD